MICIDGFLFQRQITNNDISQELTLGWVNNSAEHRYLIISLAPTHNKQRFCDTKAEFDLSPLHS